MHLQQDIDSLSSYVTDKQLQFNATKCRQMLISRKRAHSSTPPNLYVSGTALLQVSEYKYLGVVITSDLSWRPHITNMCNKTRKLIGLLYRRFYQSSNSSILLKLYLSFLSVLKARYQLESAAEVGKFQRLILPLNRRIEGPS